MPSELTKLNDMPSTSFTSQLDEIAPPISASEQKHESAKLNYVSALPSTIPNYTPVVFNAENDMEITSARGGEYVPKISAFTANAPQPGSRRSSQGDKSPKWASRFSKTQLRDLRLLPKVVEIVDLSIDSPS